MRTSLFIPLLVASLRLVAQQPAIGPHSANRIWIQGATVHTAPGSTLLNASVLVVDGLIAYVGTAPKDTLKCLKIEGKNRHVYASFVHAHFTAGMDLEKSGYAPGPRPQSEKEALQFWPNDAVHAERWSGSHWAPKSQDLKAWWKAGFGYAIPVLDDGLIQGRFPAMSLGGPRWVAEPLLYEAALGFSFDKGESKQDYPSSLPGAAAVLRQFLVDARYAETHPEYLRHRRSLDPYLAAKNRPHFMQSPSAWDIPLWKQLFPDRNLVFVDYGEAHLLENTDLTQGDRLLFRCEMPSVPEVRDPLVLARTNIMELKQWEQRYAIPALLVARGIQLALNPGEKAEEFEKTCRAFLQHGLSEAELLSALTTQPAAWLGLDKKIGKIEAGYRAGLLIAGNPLGHEDGLQTEGIILEGEYLPLIQSVERRTLNFMPSDSGLDSLAFVYTEKGGKAQIVVAGKTLNPEQEAGGSLIFEWPKSANRLYFPKWQATHSSAKPKVELKFMDTLGGIQSIAYRVEALQEEPEQETEIQEKISEISTEIYRPFHAFGYSGRDQPQQKDMVIRSALVWTGQAAGVTETDVYVKKGKIAGIGKDLAVPKGTAEINGKGKHLTAGIIDEHSHIALRNGVNESGSAISAEVRMKDGLNPDDPAIYRQLASGVTAAQLLHGSANPIGGQSALIRMKWGAPASSMLMPEAPAFNKFALGENVKQSNWGERFTIRYPQTRLGVQTFIREQFLKAKNPEPGPPSLRYEILNEILAGKRNITCHSYVSSEILMLMQLADSMGFKIRTFTHVLEGYKVAKEMAAHGAAGSTFSDWWAYKAEVNDAIPYNAAIMHKAGILTALNSDDEAMGTRLNLEAAKMVRYGNISEAEAWNMVTLNPAKMLGIDKKVGSIEIGKEADLVLWNGHPMVAASVPEFTWIEGFDYYSQERHNRMLQRNEAEAKRLLPVLIKAISEGEKPEERPYKSFNPYHCEDLNP